MPQTRPPYAPEFPQQMVELVRAVRTPRELAKEFFFNYTGHSDHRSIGKAM